MKTSFSFLATFQFMVPSDGCDGAQKLTLNLGLPCPSSITVNYKVKRELRFLCLLEMQSVQQYPMLLVRM